MVISTEQESLALNSRVKERQPASLESQESVEQW